MPPAIKMRRGGVARAVQGGRADPGLSRKASERVRCGLRAELDADLVSEDRPTRVGLVDVPVGKAVSVLESLLPAKCLDRRSRQRNQPDASGLGRLDRGGAGRL